MHPHLRGSVAHLFRPGLDLGATGTIAVDDDEHHLRRVLRVRDGELVTVSDGAGAWVPCRYVAGQLDIDGDVHRESPSVARLTVAFAPVKGERTEWTVEKLVEIGIDHIAVLAPTARSVVRWDERRAMAQHDRLVRTALAAASQSRRVWLPEVRVGVALSSIAGGDVAAAEPDGSALDGRIRTVVVGPEGGFEPAEIAGWPTVGLGGTILRAETAALVAAALMVAHQRG